MLNWIIFIDVKPGFCVSRKYRPLTFLPPDPPRFVKKVKTRVGLLEMLFANNLLQTPSKEDLGGWGEGEAVKQFQRAQRKRLNQWAIKIFFLPCKILPPKSNPNSHSPKICISWRWILKESFDFTFFPFPPPDPPRSCVVGRREKESCGPNWRFEIWNLQLLPFPLKPPFPFSDLGG